ncbi:MAG: hypothetical protein LBV76_02035, partial [Deltaproteobacteria bacterium]|nr:hypothetical protein [Deltaproteobacteria bacterium]
MFSNGISGFFGKIKTALRARYLRRKVFCWLLVYCHLLLAFSGLANLFLPGLDDVAAAVGVTEALQGDFVRQARGLAGLVLEKRA